LPKKNGYFTERKIKNAVGPSSKPIALGNIFEVFSQLENIALILSDFLQQMERLIKLMEINRQISAPQVPDNSSVFVKRIFHSGKA